MIYQQIYKHSLIRLSWFLLLITSISLGACTQPKIDPLKLKILPQDRARAEFPPSEEELLTQPRLALPLVVYRGGDVTDSRLQRAFNFFQTAFKKHGNFTFIPLESVNLLLKKNENAHFQTTNVADAIEMAKKQNASFVVQLSVDLLGSQRIKGVDHFKIRLDTGVITTNSGQVVFKEAIFMDTRNLTKSKKKIKKQVQKNFPLKGYILETRGGHQVAKISIGRSKGLTVGRKLLIRNRTVKKVMVNGVVKRTISFDPQALANAKVIEIHEDYAWITIEKETQEQIKAGQVVFTVPEKGFWR